MHYYRLIGGKHIKETMVLEMEIFLLEIVKKEYGLSL